MTCLLMVPVTGKVEEDESDLTDDQGLCADGTTDAVPHNADSKPEALEVGGDRDPAKERDEVCQASDVCFLGDKDKASMVTPPQKSIQLKESSVEKSADREAEQEKEQKREQRRVSVLRPAPNDSDQQRQQRRDASSQKQKSSRLERRKRGGTHSKDLSAGGGCKSKGSKGSTERTRLDEKNPEQSPSENLVSIAERHRVFVQTEKTSEEKAARDQRSPSWSGHFR
ncbi:hypothetical protein HPB47_013933 [Ixodes persulcatus]|uniref:Uncharacterized protein n=1 Tax=Ixodes persulcatus TaxID=34615 RepID=A0AC60QX95_IXOPE|nr:hypothetical protein HPB47_013933 [Ixodes persulcatus]